MDSAEMPRPSDEPGPLSGLRVVEIGNETGEYTGLLLAGLGAEVVKIEPPEGGRSRRIAPFYEDVVDPERSLHFWAYNRGKKSVVLDLGVPADVERMRSLLASSDVLVDTTRRETLAEVGIAPASFESLVHARLTPFGDTGPWADFTTNDLVSLALGGVTMNCGYDPEPDGTYDLPPIAPQAWHSMHIAGEQLAIGVVAALLARSRTGRGQLVSSSIHEAVAKNTELDVPSWIFLRQPVFRQTCRHAMAVRSDPSISYTKDGRWLLSMSMGPRDLRNLPPFLERHGVEGALGGAEPAEKAAEGVRAVGGSTADATSATEAIQRMSRQFSYDRLPWRDAQEAGLIWSPIRKPHESVTDEHWISRGTVAEVEHPEIGRSIIYPVSKWISTRGSWTKGTRAPLLGEHADDVFRAPVTARPRLSRRESTAPEGLSMMGRPFPLQGVRILDFTWFLASAGATRFLAALGADVIKVEWKKHPDTGRGSLNPVGGRAAREQATSVLSTAADPSVGGQFNNKNPGKRGLSLNVGDPRGLEIAKALVAKSDLVTEGFSPGVLERWGLGYDVLRSLRSDIIYVKQSGMGAFGMYGRMRALGPIAAAFSGVSEMSGLPEPAPPAGWGYSYLDWFGAYSMALSCLTALYHREQTGEGQWIDASQTEAGIFLTGEQLADWSANGRVWRRTGNRSHNNSAAPHGIYRAVGVDRWIAIACTTEEQWRTLARVAGHQEWLDDRRFATLEARLSNQDALDRLVEDWTAKNDPSELMLSLQAQGVPAGLCQNAEDRYDYDPQLKHAEWLTELTATRLGRWPVAALPFQLSETPAHVGGLPHRGAPLYGEDNASVLGELLGLSESAVAHLAEEGVL